MPRKPEVAEETNIKFVQLSAGGDGELYALDELGRVFVYIDDDKSQGWFQLEHDDTRVAVEETE